MDFVLFLPVVLPVALEAFTEAAGRRTPRASRSADVFLMREVAGLGYQEIAAACDLSPDAVRSRIHRTRLQLRQQLATPIATFQTLATRRQAVTPEMIEP